MARKKSTPAGAKTKNALNNAIKKEPALAAMKDDPDAADADAAAGGPQGGASKESKPDRAGRQAPKSGAAPAAPAAAGAVAAKEKKNKDNDGKEAKQQQQRTEQAKPKKGRKQPEPRKHAEEALTGQLGEIHEGFADDAHVVTVVSEGRFEARTGGSPLFDDVANEPGMYLWTVTPPGLNVEVPMYVGATGARGKLRKQLSAYVNKNNRTFGPQGELQKYLALVDAMSRGFTIKVRFAVDKQASSARQEALKKYDFPLNSRGNDDYRVFKLPGGMAWFSYQVLERNAHLQAHTEDVRKVLKGFNRAPCY